MPWTKCHGPTYPRQNAITYTTYAQDVVKVAAQLNLTQLAHLQYTFLDPTLLLVYRYPLTHNFSPLLLLVITSISMIMKRNDELVTASPSYSVQKRANKKLSYGWEESRTWPEGLHTRYFKTMSCSVSLSHNEDFTAFVSTQYTWLSRTEQ